MLAGAGLFCVTRATDIPEEPRPGEAPEAFALRAASEKAQAGLAVRRSGDPSVVLASDTVVALGSRILGKPGSAAEAAEMLGALSGRTHEVITAFAWGAPERSIVADRAIARVTFRALSAQDIDAYVASGEPMDKAGAYGIQGLAGAFVESVDGPYDAVVGLPLDGVLRALEGAGAIPAFGSDAARNLAVLRGRVAAAVQAVGRSVDEIVLVAVTKTLPAETVRAAQALGLCDFGENYVQEWREKSAALGDTRGVKWHFIGHLQSNKAKYLAPLVAVVHTLDSAATAEALDRAAARAGRAPVGSVGRQPGGVPIDVLIQVNVGGEVQKSGIEPADAPALVAAVRAMAHLRLRGLMTVPPDGPLCATRAHFATLRRLRDTLATPETPLPWLSMGMSGDFDQAIAEGATHIRVGSALFGRRPAKAKTVGGELA